MDADVVIVGAGILGLATARALLLERPGLAVTVVEKEDRIAAHQSGRNSGVVHAGLYYRPGSDKARMVAAGRAALEVFAREHAIGWNQSGKLVLATTTPELAGLVELESRATAQGVATELVNRRRIAEIEPHADGLAGLWVPSTAVVDFPAVCAALATEIIERGGTIQLSCAVDAVDDAGDHLHVTAGHTTMTTRTLVTCAGLQADLVAGLAGAALPNVRIAPFRGEYHELVPERDYLVRGLIYPVPDPRFPFLGVHLTRGVHGDVHVGPNAVPAFSREGYSWREADDAGVREWLTGAGSLALARRYWRTGAAEIARSFSRRALVKALQRLVPDIRSADLHPAPAGVRAQALRSDGTLLDDFAFGETARVVSVLNAPSPAATASLEIGRVIAARLLPKLGPGA